MSKDLAPAELLRLISLREIFGGFAHEIAQPFNAIMIASQVVRLKVERAQLPPEEEDFLCQRLDLISDQVRRATDIVDELRSFSREEGQKTRGADLREVFEKVHGLMSQQFVSRGIDLTWEALGKLPATSIGFYTAEGIVVIAMAFARDTVQALGTGKQEHSASYRKAVDVKLQTVGTRVQALFRWAKAGPPDGALTIDPQNNAGIMIAGSILSACDGSLETADDSLTITFPA
jgi:nitrogen-specific signal transduction histidine kinase